MKCKCKKCGWEWIPRIETKPKQCPKCKLYDWDKPKRKYIKKA